MVISDIPVSLLAPTPITSCGDDVLGYPLSRTSEIASMRGCSSGSSKSQLHKARRALRRSATRSKVLG